MKSESSGVQYSLLHHESPVKAAEETQLRTPTAPERLNLTLHSLNSLIPRSQGQITKSPNILSTAFSTCAEIELPLRALPRGPLHCKAWFRGSFKGSCTGTTRFHQRRALVLSAFLKNWLNKPLKKPSKEPFSEVHSCVVISTKSATTGSDYSYPLYKPYLY